nr:ankyrin repeat domain-containing protein [Novosphingobium flavum]
MGGPGRQFLEAIRKREGADVDKALGPTGTPTIINTQDVTTGDTALHIVTARRDLEWLRFLLLRGADPNKANVKGVRPIGVAVSLGWVEGVQQLIERGARVDDPGETGETPLMTAVHQRDIELVRILIKAGASATRADNSGRSAKDYATLMGSESAIAQELNTAAKAAAARKATTYGPSF